MQHIATGKTYVHMVASYALENAHISFNYALNFTVKQGINVV